MLKSMQKNGVRLSLFALVCTGAIVLTNVKTEDTIATQQQHKLAKLLDQMLPANSYNNQLSNSCRLVSSPLLGDTKAHRAYIATQDGKLTGVVIETVAPDGYSGKIQLLAGISETGVVHRVEVLEHHETPGLGDKIDRNKSDWLDHFAGSSASTQWAVKKDGGEFDSFTGATITPRAIVKATKHALDFVTSDPTMFTQAPECEAK